MPTPTARPDAASSHVTSGTSYLRREMNEPQRRDKPRGHPVPRAGRRRTAGGRQPAASAPSSGRPTELGAGAGPRLPLPGTCPGLPPGRAQRGSQPSPPRRQLQPRSPPAPGATARPGAAPHLSERKGLGGCSEERQPTALRAGYAFSSLLPRLKEHSRASTPRSPRDDFFRALMTAARCACA